MCNSQVWDVSLFPIVHQVLAYIHENFFNSLDQWLSLNTSQRGPPPSALGYFKEYLRKELSNQIALGG